MTAKQPLRPPKRGWTSIDLLRLAVIAAMVGASIYFVVTSIAVVTSKTLASPLDLSLPADSITTPYPENTSIVDATARVEIETGLAARIAWWSVTDALAIVGIGFLELLRRLLANRENLFTEQNAARLRWMVVLALVFASVSLIRPLVSIAIQDNAGFEGLEAVWDFSSLGGALVLAALLEGWREGVALQSEQDLTV